MSANFEYLFTPYQIGSVTIKNRICSSSHGTLFADKDHILDDRYVEYQRTRARGGAGLIIAGMFDVSFNCRSLIGQMEIFDPKVVPMLQKLGDALHAEGTKVFAQLSHNGREADTDLTRMATWAPSAIPDMSYFRAVPKAMEHEDIQTVVKAFATAARHVRQGGLDGIEIHGASGYLVGQFLSPSSNKRTDEYGGSVEKRMRFLYEIIDAIREEVGDDFVVGVRLPGDELVKGGNTIDGMVDIAKRLDERGDIDFVHTGLPFYEGIFGVGFGMHTPLGLYTQYAAAFKEAIDLPVINTFRINDPVQAEKILANGHADLVGMTRAMISDPEMPNKAKAGRLDEIRHCIGCDQGCLAQVFQQKPMSCLQNAAVGRELEIGRLDPVVKKKRVLIIGGGPAGLEAARVARTRGHDVVLFERDQQLGGQVNLAVKVPIRTEFGGMVRYLSRQMEILGVDIRLGCEASLPTVLAESPDVVIVAAGSEPLAGDFPGAQQANVITVRQLLSGSAAIGDKVLVVDGGDSHWEVLSTGEFLIDQGKQVELISPVLFVGDAIATTSDLTPYYRRVRSKGLVLSPNTVLQSLSGNTAVVLDVYSGTERQIDVDNVVLSLGNVPSNALYYQLKGQVSELHMIGDCLAPRKAMEAIHDAYQLARLI